MLRHCDYQLFLLVDGNAVRGRISAFVDRKAVKHWGKRIGLFGSFECIEDVAAAQRLVNAASSYLVGQRCVSMRGPWSFASQDWGLVVEGYKPPPVVMAPYNFPFYGELIEAAGLEKATDLLVYEANARDGYQFPERAVQVTDSLVRREDITIRPLDRSRLKDEIELIEQISSEAHANGWGFAPTLVNETRVLVKDTRGEAMVQIACDKEGRAIGYSTVVPDLNMVLRGGNGSLYPSLWWKLATKRKKICSYRMRALTVIPEYQGKGVDSLLYRRAFEALESRTPRIEVNYILEEDKRVSNAIERMGLEQIRRYRVYEKYL